MADDTRLGRELAKLEQEDPEVRVAAERYERTKKKILDTPPFEEEDLAPLDEVAEKIRESLEKGHSFFDLSPNARRRVLRTVWEKRKLERESQRHRLVLAFASYLNMHRGETVLLNELALLTEEETAEFDRSIKDIRERAVREYTGTVKGLIHATFGPKSLDCPRNPPCTTCVRCRFRALLK